MMDRYIQECLAFTLLIKTIPLQGTSKCSKFEGLDQSWVHIWQLHIIHLNENSMMVYKTPIIYNLAFHTLIQRKIDVELCIVLYFSLNDPLVRNLAVVPTIILSGENIKTGPSLI